MSFNFKLFADQIAGELKGNCMGYAFVVSYKDDWKEKRAGGHARTQQNPPTLEMSTSVPFHIASISKAISGAALVKLLYERHDVKLDDRFHPLLPDHWHVDESIRGITFRQLLNHTSGFPDWGYEYHQVKKHIAEGLNPNEVAPNNYAGFNYGIIQYLVPRLAGYSIPQTKHADANFETIQAAAYSGFYIDYVRSELFKKAGLSKLGCVALPYTSGVCYQFPKNGKAGTSFGDASMLAAAKGWVMSAEQMAKFFRKLHFTEAIMPFSQSKRLGPEQLGYYGQGKTTKGVQYYSKGGMFPGSKNPGALHSLIIAYQNDVQVAMIINSDLDNEKGMTGIINEAHDRAFIKFET